MKESEVAQSCPTLCDPMVCILPGSSVHRFFQARILEWVAISFSRGSSQPRGWTRVSSIAGRCFTLYNVSYTHAVIVVQSLSHVQLFVPPWTSACQTLLLSTLSWNLLKFISIESVMLSFLTFILVVVQHFYKCLLQTSNYVTFSFDAPYPRINIISLPKELRY